MAQITDISDLLDLTDWYGDYANDFDQVAVRADYVTALDEAAGPGVWVTDSGLVFADEGQVDRAREIDWAELVDDDELSAIAQRHDISGRA